MAADAAARGIRQVDSQGAIGLIGQENDPPYNRPPLSKGLWKRTPLSRIWRSTASLGVELHLGRSVVQLDPALRRVIDDHGAEFTFDKLLLATGGDPIRLHAQSPDSHPVIYFRTLADYQRLREMTETTSRFAVIGGGFIGSEIAAALASKGKDVTMIFPEGGIGARLLPLPVSQFLNRNFEEQGIRVETGKLVSSVETRGEKAAVQLTTGEELLVDGVVAGMGIRPNVALGLMAGLETGDGLVVDSYLRTNHPDIFAAGDVISFYNSALNRQMRVEHEENANLTGQFAGQGMAGELTRYDHLPSVYSTLFDISYDAVGDLDPRLEVVYDWQEPFRKGVVYYLHNQRVRGVLLWNVPRGLDTARQIIAEPGPFQAKDLIGRISI